MEIEKFFLNVFNVKIDDERIKELEKLYNGPIQDTLTAQILSCMRERALKVKGKTTYTLLALDLIKTPNSTFTKNGLVPLFRIGNDKFICYNVNCGEEKKIYRYCLFNLTTKEFGQKYPNLFLFFQDDFPELFNGTKSIKTKYHSIFCTTKDRSQFFIFRYNVVAKKGINVREIHFLTEKGVIIKEVNFIVPFAPSIQFDKMYKEVGFSAEKFYKTFAVPQANWRSEFWEIVESENFDFDKMLDRIKEIDLYANVCKLYETVIEKIEKGEIK